MYQNQVRLNDSADMSNLSKQEKQSSGGSEVSTKPRKYCKKDKKDFFFKKSSNNNSESGSGEKELTDYPFQGKIIQNVKTHKGSLQMQNFVKKAPMNIIEIIIDEIN